MSFEKRLPGPEEIEYRLFSFSLALVYRSTLIISLIFFSIALYSSTAPILAGLENYEKRVPGFLEAREAKGFFGRVSLRETIESLNSSHPLFEIEQRPWEWISYDFGSTQGNYCYRKPYPEGSLLPSLLRIFELRATTQFFTRLGVLLAIGIRLFMTAVSVNYLYQKLDYSESVKVVRFMLPILDVSWMTMATLVLCLQQDQDKKIKWFMSYHLPFFAILFITYSVGYIILSAAALRNTLLQMLQIFFVIVFTACFPQVYLEYLDFLAPLQKVCHIYVPFNTAVMEYCAIGAVILFTISQFSELQMTVGFVSITRLELDESLAEMDVYSPAYAQNKRTNSETSVESEISFESQTSQTTQLSA